VLAEIELELENMVKDQLIKGGEDG